MTIDDKNTISSELILCATATEHFIRMFLNMERYTLTGKSKMLINNMTRHIKAARIYFSEFTDKISDVLYQDGKDWQSIDNFRRKAADRARIMLLLDNLNYNGYTDENIEEHLKEVLNGIEDRELIINQEVIDKFRIL